MNKVEFYTEKGNPAVSVRNQMKAQTVSYLEKVLTDAFGTAEVNTDKEISVPVAEDANTGTPIYARISFTVTDRDPNAVSKKGKATKDNEPTEVPNLFE